MGEMPQVPGGNGKHPIPLVVVAANNLAASTAFYIFTRRMSARSSTR